MLKHLRKKGVAKKIIWVVAIIIIISFGFLGTAYLVTDSLGMNYAGRIFGKKVTLEEFDGALKHVRMQAIMQYGDNFKSIQQYLDFDAQAWDRLILRHEADKNKIKATNEEVVSEIESYGFFQRGGQFDTLLYNDIVRYVFGVRPHEFEETIRENLRLRKLFEGVTSGISMTDDQAFEEYQKQNEKVLVSYALAKTENFTDPGDFDQTMARQHYEENKEAFRRQPTIRVDYVRFALPPKPVAEPAAAPADPAGETPENTPDPEIDPEQLAAYEKAREEILATAASAKKAVEASTAEKLVEVAMQFKGMAGGTGYFSANEPNAAPGWSFDTLRELFQAETGYVTNPFESDNGIFVARLSDKRESYVPPYEEVENLVRDELLKKGAKARAQKKAEEFAEALKNASGNITIDQFTAQAQKQGFEISQTPAFNRGQYLPRIGISSEFQQAAFSLNESRKVSPAVDTGLGAAVLYLEEYIPADRAEFEKDKEALKEKLLAEKKNEATNEYLSRLRVAAKLDDNIARLRQKAQPGAN